MRIRIARIEMQLSQQQLADLTEGVLSQQMISRIEKGKRDVSLVEMATIAQCLEREIEEFVI